MRIVRDRVALNPLQYYATPDGWLDFENVPSLEDRLAYIGTTEFGATQTEVPKELTVEQYRELLAKYGLRPGPGYLDLEWTEDAEARARNIEAVVETTRKNVALGVPLMFMSMGMDENAPRVAHPAVGFDADQERLDGICDFVREAATRVTEAGGIAAFHPHIGSWIETADEARYLLDHVDASVLKFGPDAGHLAWTGVDPAEIIGEYRDRVAGIHIKDYRKDIADRSREADWSYKTAAREGIWTELGTGDMPIARILDVLPDTFDGWIVVEVDRGTTPTAEESIALCSEWLKAQLEASVLAG